MLRFQSDPARVGTSHVQIFIPDLDQDGNEIPRGQEYWVESCLEVMGGCFGGATALPPARGVWRDEGGDLLFERPVLVFSYVAESDLSPDAAEQLQEFVLRLGREGNQGEVGVLVDGTYHGFQNFTVASPEPQKVLHD